MKYVLTSSIALALAISSISNVYAKNLEEIVREAARKHKVDENLICAIINQESRWKQNAVSHAGAIGVMQIMPKTGKKHCNLSSGDLYDPTKNINCGVSYFKTQYDQFKSVKLALCAYNAGPHRITEYNGCPPYGETQNYQRKILKAWRGGYQCPNGIGQTRIVNNSISVKKIADQKFLAGSYEPSRWWIFVCEAINAEYYKKYSTPAISHAQKTTWLQILRATVTDIHRDELRTKKSRAWSKKRIKNRIVAACKEN